MPAASSTPPSAAPATVDTCQLVEFQLMALASAARSGSSCGMNENSAGPRNPRAMPLVNSTTYSGHTCTLPRPPGSAASGNRPCASGSPATGCESQSSARAHKNSTATAGTSIFLRGTASATCPA